MGQMMGKGISAPALQPNIDSGTPQPNFGNLSGLNLPSNLSGFGKKK